MTGRVKVTAELRGVSKEQIKIESYDVQVDIRTEDTKRKYHEVVELPAGAGTENVKSTFINGLLEITFNKKSKDKPRGKQVKID